MTTVVVVVHIIGSPLDSVATLGIVDVGLNILNVLSVQGVMVDLMVSLIGSNIFGVAVEVLKTESHAQSERSSSSLSLTLLFDWAITNISSHHNVASAD